MLHRALTLLLTLALLLAFAGQSQAQLSQYNFPIESAILESHIDLQYQYSRLSVGPTDVNVSLLSAEGQIALGSIELSINVPFISHGWTSSLSETQFGDLMLGFKWRLFGVGKNFGVALFANTWLPTHSGDFTREYAQIQAGGAVSAKVWKIQLGGGIQSYWMIIGENVPDLGTLGFYGFGSVPIFGPITLIAAVEYANAIHPNGKTKAFFISPGLEVSVVGAHVGIGARIAATDDGKALNFGRAALVANAGYRF